LGFARLHWISWNNGNAFVSLGIADAQERGKGYGSEALHLILRYAFAELNLFHLSVSIPEYNQVAMNDSRRLVSGKKCASVMDCTAMGVPGTDLYGNPARGMERNLRKFT
jgi:hypothetical protein